MDEKERLKKQLDFILEVDKVKNIFRQTYLADGNRKENDAEHSWHLALMAVLLKEYSNEEVDLGKVIPMVLTHDLVEIDAGDTYAYDEKVRRQKMQGSARRQSGFTGFFRRNREHGLKNSGRNSRLTKHRKRNLPMFWTTASRFSLMMLLTERAGKNIR